MVVADAEHDPSSSVEQQDQPIRCLGENGQGLEGYNRLLQILFALQAINDVSARGVRRVHLWKL